MSEERTLVTILFADVTESTALGESLDPEDVRALMSRYYKHAQRIVSQYSGTLEKFIGDVVMAIFGLPQVHGDDAERALAAALALREAVRADPLLGERFVLRMGGNTGEVVGTTDASSSDFLVTGDAVNVTMRLQQAASPGEIFAGERTARAAQAAFLFADPQFIQVKGKHDPLRVFPLREARAVRLVGHPPLVGRRQELLHLEERRPQLISIVAPAGTGKTRLLEEFLAQLDPAEGFQVATSRCQPYGETLTFWPLRGLLAGLLGSNLEPLEAAREHVTAVFVRGGYAAHDATHLTEEVLTTLGIEREGVSDRENLFNAWRLLIEACARQTPLLVVFEDLHWASESLLDLVEHLLYPRTQAPLLIIVLSRPELLDRRPSWGGGRPNFTSLALEPLCEPETQVLVDQLKPGLPPTVRQRIVERSGGNPFFVIELMRGLTERGPNEAAVSLETLPDTVHAAILARLDLLSPLERAVMRVAAVAGRPFRPDMLQAMPDTSRPSELDAALDTLLTRNLLVAAEGGTFTLQHMLIRDVAYGTLTRAERIGLHSRLAHWFEGEAATRGDDFTELIAYHYREAVRLARQAAVHLDLPLDPARAVYYLERAGELAGQLGALIEAQAYLQSALELAPAEEHLRLYEALGDATAFWGSQTAVDAYRRAIALWRATAEQSPLVGARLLRKFVVLSVRRLERPQEDLVGLLAEAERLLDREEDEDERWRIRLAHVWVLLWRVWHDGIPMQAVEEGREMALSAAAYFEHRADWAAFSEALAGYSGFSEKVGAYHDVLSASQQRLRAPDLPLLERRGALSVMARAYSLLGDYHHCAQSVREALAQLRPGEAVWPFLYAVDEAPIALYVTGRWSEFNGLVPVLEEAWEQVRHDPLAATTAAPGYLTVLLVALAREDHVAIDAAASTLERCVPVEDVALRSLIAAHKDNDPSHLNLDPPDGGYLGPILWCLNLYGVSAPPKLIERMHREWTMGDAAVQNVEIAEALLAEDVVRLASAIDEAECHGLIPFGARMRIVLAQRTGDRTQLDRARPVLEWLGDRRSLRWLEEVATALHEQATFR
jgi:class 3 adenylate cyclase/tetratricopeptide (TPR) repeat protein